ncbi:MAG: Hint domain-containing protein [Roseicyclus sp.]
MPDGYLVNLGPDGVLNAGDVIVDGLVTFTTDQSLGAGDWSWNGDWGGGGFTNEQEPGEFILADDGNVYFVPAFGPVDTLDSAAVINVTEWEPSDGEVSGSDGDDLIDGGFSDLGGDDTSNAADSIHGFDGNDTIEGGGGADTIFGDGGNDVIDGGGGADVIFGDTATDAPTVSGVFSWETAQADEQDISGGITLTSAGINATVSFTDTGNNNPIFQIESTDDLYVGAGEPFGGNSALYLAGNGGGDTSETQISFSADDPDYSGAVENVSFRINDFDFGNNNHRDTLTINALDAAGDPVSITLTLGNQAPTSGPNQTIAAGTFSGNPDDLDGSLLVEIAGPVSSITFDYSNNLNGTQAIWVSDIAFDAIPADQGNDTISGGGGNDVIHGQGGDDSITGDNGADTLDGGAGNDTISGGNQSDVITGGSGNDLLTGGAGNDSIEGGDDADTLSGDDGNDILIGGAGADSIDGGAGDDTIEVAEGDTVLGGTGDDFFLLTDLGEGGAADLTIIGGEGGEFDGDVLDLNGLNAGQVTYTNTDDNAGGLSGSVQLIDGSILTFSEIEDVICFTPGTRILTPQGERPIETLHPGDLVITRDDGPQPIRWMGARMGSGKGKNAPIRVNAGGLFGARRPFLVSPQHRMLVEGYRAELACGDREVLVSAKHLIDGRQVECAPCTAVTYIHMMFDRHQVIYAEGAASESLHLGDEGLSALSAAGRADLFSKFPQYQGDPGLFGPTARRCAKAFEARLLAA